MSECTFSIDPIEANYGNFVAKFTANSTSTKYVPDSVASIKCTNAFSPIMGPGDNSMTVNGRTDIAVTSESSAYGPGIRHAA
jgi:hypothetical protein